MEGQPEHAALTGLPDPISYIEKQRRLRRTWQKHHDPPWPFEYE
jgi:hypothetical protein